MILMDMQMPVMDGPTAIIEIRRVEAASGAPRTPIHVLTANAMPEHVQVRTPRAPMVTSQSRFSPTTCPAVSPKPRKRGLRRRAASHARLTLGAPSAAP